MIWGVLAFAGLFPVVVCGFGGFSIFWVRVVVFCLGELIVVWF